MRAKLLFLWFMITPGTAIAQGHRVPVIPDIPGYKTLLCDFRLKTVFSDGYVWPTVRVDEALREGLDAIAITDHLDHMPYKDDIRANPNRSFEIASDYASGKNIIVIPGTEITNTMPPGDVCALFIKDASLIKNSDYRASIEEAAGQGAFIMWSHPGWEGPDTIRWRDEYTFLYEQGWLHGLEVINHGEYYPQTVDWAIEKDLTLTGSSNKRAPFLYKAFSPEDHRPMTLVFATEKSIGGIRDALFNGRTAAYNGYDLIGRDALLKALFLQSLSISGTVTSNESLQFVNTTDFSFNIVLEETIYQDWKMEATINPGHEITILLPHDADPAFVKVKVKNLITGTDTCLELFLSEFKAR